MTPSSDVQAEQRVLLAGGLLKAATREMRVLAATRGRSWRTARRIAGATAAAALALSLLGAPAAGLTPEFVSPFLIPGIRDYSSRPDLADIDGDLDAFIGSSSGNTIFFENTGSSTAPAFGAPSTNPFGLADVGFDSSPAFAAQAISAFGLHSLSLCYFFERF